MTKTNDATRVAAVPCALGWVLVGATERGVCLILLGDDPISLMGRFRGDAGAVGRRDAEFDGWVAQVVDLIESPGSACDVPLDIRGTPFQRRVWDALRAIPAGETSTYSEIAARVGAPAAVRAVGTACGANPVAPIVPCHRVLRSDGSLGGYGFGLDRKRSLLAREGVALPTVNRTAPLFVVT